MAKKKGGAKKGGKDKAKVAKVRKPRQLYKLYEIKGDELIRKNRYSPKSPGDFLANHKDRLVCGKSAYTEWKGKD